MPANIVLLGSLLVDRRGPNLEPVLMFKYFDICIKRFVNLDWPVETALTHEMFVELDWLSYVVPGLRVMVRLDHHRIREHQGVLLYLQQRKSAWLSEMVKAKKLWPDGSVRPAPISHADRAMMKTSAYKQRMARKKRKESGKRPKPHPSLSKRPATLEAREKATKKMG